MARQAGEEEVLEQAKANLRKAKTINDKQVVLPLEFGMEPGGTRGLSAQKHAADSSAPRTRLS